MLLDHPNVVMAHHVVTLTQNCPTSSSNVMSSGSNVISSSSNSQAAYSQSGSCQLTSSSIGSLQSGREHSDDLGPLSQSSCGSIKRAPELPDIAEDCICVHPKTDQISSRACEGSTAVRAQPVKAVQPAAGVPQDEHAAASDADVAQTWLVQVCGMCTYGADPVCICRHSRICSSSLLQVLPRSIVIVIVPVHVVMEKCSRLIVVAASCLQELCDAGTLHDAVRAGRFLDAHGKVDRVSAAITNSVAHVSLGSIKSCEQHQQAVASTACMRVQVPLKIRISLLLWRALPCNEQWTCA